MDVNLDELLILIGIREVKIAKLEVSLELVTKQYNELVGNNKAKEDAKVPLAIHRPTAKE